MRRFFTIASVESAGGSVTFWVANAVADPLFAIIRRITPGATSAGRSSGPRPRRRPPRRGCSHFAVSSVVSTSGDVALGIALSVSVLSLAVVISVAGSGQTTLASRGRRRRRRTGNHLTIAAVVLTLADVAHFVAPSIANALFAIIRAISRILKTSLDLRSRRRHRPRSGRIPALVVVTAIDAASGHETRFGRRGVTPLFDHGLLNPPRIGSRSHADLFGHVDAVLVGLQSGHQFGHVFAFALGLKVAHFFGHFLNDGLFLILTLLRSGLHRASRRTTQFKRNLFAFGLGREFLYCLSLQIAFLHRPTCATLFG